MNTVVQAIPLRDVVRLDKGKPPAKQEYFGSDAGLYLTPEYLRGKGNAELVKPSANAVFVEDGEAIILWDGSNAGEIFKAKKGVLASTMSRISHGDEYDRDYFYYALKGWEEYLKGQTSGSGIPHVDKEVLGKLKLFDYPKPEQTKIAEVLSTVDRAIEQTEALIAKQQRIKTGLMQDLLTKGIDEHGILRNEATHKFKDSPLGRIPVEWDVGVLGDIVGAVDPQPDHRTPAEVKEGIPYIGVSDFRKDGSIDFDRSRKVSMKAFEKQRESFHIAEGDFVFGKIGTIGLPRRLPIGRNYALSANVILLQPYETKSFVYWWMESPIAERLVDLELHTTSQPAFGIKKMRLFKIPMPSEGERVRIGDILDDLGKRIEADEKALAKLKSIKTALMQDLLTGKKRVTPLLSPATTD